MTQLNGKVEKGWGYELIWATNELYTGKLMKFNRGAKFSMHFHVKKDESWYVLSGRFIVRVIKTETADQFEEMLHEGDIWRNKPLAIHQLECLEEGIIIEVSTPDSVEDNYRVEKGDSQR